MGQGSSDKMQRHKDKGGEMNICARCGDKGVTAGILCYVRRQVIIIPRFKIEPEARYITDRSRLEQDLAAVDFKDGIICRRCAESSSGTVARSERLDA